ncbi:PTS lactose/cellobiose transporter subunit IIA [Oceanobacillus sojae]|uniref:PTS lactose/cellobiose transporter subunit IIA n=1 Tax=Oceanobacillus sojae TaxID=582851 RepID=UPI0021A7A7D3|nr:PTS lactose/cellobiose transporter subunit IIA [Oceanobacillus sojae]MCT1905232.1 PTS lactose/cellobiose transporter subunit IIA [Oceanobacillus sojae]
MEDIKEIQQLSFQIILHAGNAKSDVMNAVTLAKNSEFEEAAKKMNLAEDSFAKAHHMQTKLLQDEANGKVTELSVILIHAQDHLMNALTVKDLAVEMIDMYQKINHLEEK